MGKEKKSKKEGLSKFCNLEAMRAVYDAQKFADRLFACLESKKNEKFVVRLLQTALCSRMIGIHQLQTLGFYSYLHRYLQPKQKEVTRILLYDCWSMTVGLNTIREIFSTCPAAATEELLRDLAEYKTFKNKNVSMAARALITLFRSVNPRLLHQKDRGRPNQVKDAGAFSEQKRKLEYGAINSLNFIPGSEVLPEYGAPQMYEEEPDSDDDEWVDLPDSDALLDAGNQQNPTMADYDPVEENREEES